MPHMLQRVYNARAPPPCARLSAAELGRHAARRARHGVPPAQTPAAPHSTRGSLSFPATSPVREKHRQRSPPLPPVIPDLSSWIDKLEDLPD